MTKQELLDKVRKLATSEVQRLEEKLAAVDNRSFMEKAGAALALAQESIPRSIDEMLSSLVPEDSDDDNNGSSEK